MARTDGDDGDPTETADDGLPEIVIRALDGALQLQQGIVVRHVDGIREDRPDAGPREVIEELERQFLKTVTIAGAAVGGAAAVPGVGTTAAVALGAAEIVGFLEASTLFTLAVAHVHGIDVEDIERRRALVLSVLLGAAGVEAAGQSLKRLPGPWGKVIAGRLPMPSVKNLNRSLLRRFLLRFGTRQGAFAFGRLAPFGIGAVIGGSGNRVLGHKAIRGAKEAFGPPPHAFADELQL